MLAVMALVVDRRAPKGWAGLMIWLSIIAAILLTGPITGGSVNPARTFGPYFVATLVGIPHILHRGCLSVDDMEVLDLQHGDTEGAAAERSRDVR